jgi:electron transport complex protein RnfC
MSFFLNGVSVPHRKNTANKPILHMDAPKIVTIPMSMHIGAPASVAVKVGSIVKVGTLIGEGNGAVSSDIYSSVSGKVIKIEDFTLSNGSKTQAVVIESDGEMARDESLAAPVVTSADELVEAIRKSGVVGLGGAGFPTYVKFKVDLARVEALIINCAECEPYITSDSYSMMERTQDMEYALVKIKEHFGIKKIIIGIEENKKRSIACMRELATKIEGVEVKVLPSKYPQGGEKVLVYHTTKKVIPTGKLPIDVGCIVINCTTLASIGKYLIDGTPLVKKCVTVDGGAIKNPANVLVPIGTSVAELVEFCGGFKEEPAKVLYGGPMMGITINSIDAPVIKNTNAIVALTEKEAKLPKTTACIRCGSCTNACPFGLAAAEILRAYDKKDAEKLKALSVETCMECGCCSFICPANRPLVQTNKLAKAFLKEEKAKEESKNV